MGGGPQDEGHKLRGGHKLRPQDEGQATSSGAGHKLRGGPKNKGQATS